MINNLSNLFRPDCVIYCPNGRVVSSEYLHTLTNVYKKNLYEKLNGKTVGKVGLIWSNQLDVILPCIKAMWQMGCVVSVHDYQEKIATHPAFTNFYKHVDFVVGTPYAQEILPHLPHLPAPETELEYLSYINQQPENSLYHFLASDFPDVEYVLDQPLTGNSVAVVSHTSGTTGDPKIFGISHCDAINLVKENIDIFNFKEDDRVGHLKTLHHGSLFLNYAIPAFATSKHHYWFLETYKPIFESKEFLQASMQFCYDNRLTKMLIHYPFLSENNFDNITPLDVNVTELITIVGPEPHLMNKLFDTFNPACIYNNFGCTEIGSVAVSRTTKENLNNYSPIKFSRINSLIDIKPQSHSFLIKYKTDTNWKEIGDIIEINDDGLNYYGRNTQINIDDTLFDIGKITRFLTTDIQLSNFSLVPDFTLGQLYLAFYQTYEHKKYPLDLINSQLSTAFGPKLTISKVCCFNLNQIFNGMKPSQPLLLYAFRNQE